MAISHVCLECGFDLARVRARRDPAYDLWIVRCPQCASCCARNPNQIGRTWHRILRVDMALSILLVQGLAATFMAIVNVSTVNVGFRLAQYHFIEHFWSRGHVPILVFVLGAAVGTGVWLTVAFGHLTRWKVWLGWWAVLMTLLMLFGQASRIAPKLSLPMSGESAGEWLLRLGTLLGMTALFATVYMSVAVIGILPGHLLRVGHVSFRRWRWRLRRKRRRNWMVHV